MCNLHKLTVRVSVILHKLTESVHKLNESESLNLGIPDFYPAAQSSNIIFTQTTDPR